MIILAYGAVRSWRGSRRSEAQARQQQLIDEQSILDDMRSELHRNMQHRASLKTPAARQGQDGGEEGEAGGGRGAPWGGGGIHGEERDQAREVSPPVGEGVGLDESLRDRLR